MERGEHLEVVEETAVEIQQEISAPEQEQKRLQRLLK